LENNQREQHIIHSRKNCFHEIREKERTIERISLFVFFSWFLTGPCLLFMFLAPSETAGPFLLFALLTVIGHLIKYFFKQEIERLEQENIELGQELNEVRQQIEEKCREDRKKYYSKQNVCFNSRPSLSERSYLSTTDAEEKVSYDYEEIFRHDQELKIERSREEREERDSGFFDER
jgi:hypothetical protein